MRPYVTEVLIIFAAGCCVGAYINEQRHKQAEQPTTEDEKKPETEFKIKEATIAIPQNKKGLINKLIFG